MTKETLYELIADVDEKYVLDARKEPEKRQHRRWLAPLAAAAACLALVLLVGMNGLFSPQPTPTDPYDPTKPPQPVAPPYNHFDSAAELLALFHATQGSEEEYLAYIDTLPAPESNWPFATQEGGKSWITRLQGTLLPCHADADETFHALYYYTQRDDLYFELFYDIDGLRYNLFCKDAASARKLDGQIVGTSTLAGHSFDLYEMEFGSSTRLFGNCFVGDYVYCIWVNTTDVSKVDFSGFYLGDLLDSFSGQESLQS